MARDELEGAIGHEEDWWDCPSCGGDTEIDREDGQTTGRSCTECDWSFVFPAFRGEAA